MALLKQDALDYHSQGRPGKIQIAVTKPCRTQRDLSLAYTPGVAAPCLEIASDPDAADRYTARANLVAVVTNGTAVLGLGDIGPLAGKPVMEGKGVLFKAFADIDVFDIEIAAREPADVIRFCEMLEPTVGGINLEDIKAPECFEIEEALRERLQIPVFHDDQHGTAIIAGAALLNAALLVGKKLEDLRVVFSGAGASAMSTAGHFVRLGVRMENVTMVDSKGVIHSGRKDLNRWKQPYARDTSLRTLEQAARGADVLVGLSVEGAFSQEMVRAMADRPIVFALANPNPEILPDAVRAVRPDAIIATGRSDFPNQVNNVLGFPFIFRGALDVGARAITEEMKMAATRALADLAREEDVPDEVTRAYGLERLTFGPEYLIPKPLDHRVLLRVAPAVAGAAMASGVARRKVDLEEYVHTLEVRFGRSRAVMRALTDRARMKPQRIVFPEGHHPTVLRAARVLAADEIARPIVLGDPARIRQVASEHDVDLDGVEVLDPGCDGRAAAYAAALWERRRRRGVTRNRAARLVADPNYFGSMMLVAGDADAMVVGIDQYYPDKLHAPLQCIGAAPHSPIVAGVTLLVVEHELYFLADTTLTDQPDAAMVAAIASETARLARNTFGVTPRVAMLSYSNFGSARSPETAKMAEATRILREREPELEADGEMMAETALVVDILKGSYPFSRLTGRANVLIFPNLSAANIAFQLLEHLGRAEAIGPILVGMDRPVHVLRRGIKSQDVVNMAVIAAVDAQERGRTR
ncbi:MAG TPA: NADP-dependent malic enzyme [Gemmatimonadales bacterium]|nr:NADP-dependent malic enzyme [Gemmatimonadales bacterium]